jgi:hypothetical protein
MEKPRSAAPFLAALLLLLPLLYVGSYLAVVSPAGTMLWWSGRVDHYEYGGRSVEQFYWPLEQIDRRIRPQAWRDTFSDFASP